MGGLLWCQFSDMGEIRMLNELEAEVFVEFSCIQLANVDCEGVEMHRCKPD